jgi:hypothetical protein
MSDWRFRYLEHRRGNAVATSPPCGKSIGAAIAAARKFAWDRAVAVTALVAPDGTEKPWAEAAGRG